jgi:hypothetical protein
MRNRAVRGCLIVIVLVIVPALGVHSKNVRGHHPQNLPEQQTNPTEKEKPPNPDKRGTLELPLVVRSLAPEKTQQEAADEAKERDDKRWNDRATLVIGFGTLLILVVQAIAFFVQAHRLNQTIKTMDRLGKGQSSDMKDSIVAAQMAANAAENQVALSREALITTERAFVFCERINSHWTAKKENDEIVKWTFIPIWKNSGKTPTKRARSQVNTWVDTEELPANFYFTNHANAAPTMIGLDATMHGKGLDIPIEMLKKIRGGESHAYILGWFDYDDVFAKTQRHRTEVCVEIQVTGNPIYKEGGFAYRMHGSFNGFDEDCYCKPKPYE